MYISYINIENIRGFKDIEINLERDGNPYLWNTILGDNSTGKTCLLRCLAIGLCDQGSAAALIKELEGKLRRKGAIKDGVIRIRLTDANNKKKLELETRIVEKDGDETIQKNFDAKIYRAIKKDIFICGYGVQRAGNADGSFRKYDMVEAVYTLFNYYGTLQNPEIIVKRIEDKKLKTFLKTLEQILMLDNLSNDDLNKTYHVRMEKQGIVVDGPWGSMFIEEMSDGYWSMSTLFIDFVGWQNYARPNWKGGIENIEGILLLDEIELHLHPHWQRHIVSRLKKAFPKVQFFTTTHSPIVAAGAADFEDANIILLKQKHDQIIRDKNIPSLYGKRFDEILLSEIFGLYSVKSLKSTSDITKYMELKSKKTKSESDEEEYQRLDLKLKKELPPGETDAQRVVKLAYRDALKNALQTISKEVDKEALDLEMKQQLKELFGD